MAARKSINKGGRPDAVGRLKRTLASLRSRLREAEDTLEAIRSGQVDALVVQGPVGEQVFTLKGADRRYRQLVETMNEGALLISDSGTIVYSNLRFAAMIGVPLERVIGSRIGEYVPEHWQRTLDAVLASRPGAAHAEAEVMASDGHPLRVYLSSAESWDDDEKLTCLIVTDLGAQRRSRDALGAEGLAGLIVEQAAEGVIVCDVEGRVIRASRAAELVVGENPLLKPFEEAFPLVSTESGRPISARVTAAALRGKTLSGIEATIHSEAGERVLLLSAGPILSEDRQSLGCVVSFVDITDRKRAAEERALLLENATAARAEAESANRAKDEFLAMLGHELRNPLAPILTALQLMGMRSSTGFEQERAVIERQVKHLVTLVDDLLDVSRITRGRVELSRGPIEISTVIGRAIEQAVPLIEGRNHKLDVDVEPELWVDADETRLAQVISNLLTNAAKYTEQGGQIGVRAFRRADEVVVIVRDTGSGLAPEIIPNVFDLFVQGRRTIDRSEGGLGLGLAIVRSLVTLHGGRVAARSEGIGKGSEFEISLPVSAAGSAIAPRAKVHGPFDQIAATGQTPARRVLVVDDNVDAAELLAEALADFGHETRVAFDGPSALIEAERFSPDVAVLDIGLPVMDGFELARRLREEHAAVPLRLIALTGYGQSSDRALSAAAGFDRHLVKPVEIDEVNQVIQQLTA